MKRTIRRRELLVRATQGSIGLAAIGLPGVLKGYPSNNTVRIGAIGTGGRCCRALMPSAGKVKDVGIVAVCDVWDDALERGRALALPGATATKDYREILGRNDIDAVIIGTPDHWHVPITIEACEAGKDVYVEKPLTHNALEGRAVIKAQNDHKRVVQVGMQQRSMPQFLKAYEDVIRPGKLGRIIKVHLTWNRNATLGKHRYGIKEKSVDWKRFLGNAPKQPFEEFRFRNWRWYWDFGGGLLTDLMVHYIDVANWFIGLDHPATAVTIGNHFQAEGFWQTPETIQTLLKYSDPDVQIYYEGTFSNARNAAMIEIMGRDATLYLDRGRYEFHPERARKGVEYSEFVPGKSYRGADFDSNVDGGYEHMKNFIDCVRSRKKPRAPAEAGVSAASGAHLGNLAYRENKVARWDELVRDA